MVSRVLELTRPAPNADYRAKSRYRPIAFGIGFVGLMLTVVTLVANIVASTNLTEDIELVEQIEGWSFGLTTTGFAAIKFAIALVLIGILGRLWLRVTAVRESLSVLKPDVQAPQPRGDIKTDWGRAPETAEVPAPLPIHRMARTMWAPMIAMGTMAVVAGLVVSFVWSGTVGPDNAAQGARAWTQGLQFFGEGMLLAGISFLLGSILAALREGGGDVQKSLGLPVRTLKMPVTAKLFVGFMVLGVMVSALQFALYIVAAGVDGGTTFAAWSAWLGPLRELGLGLLLAGIVMALVTIGNVLTFQFDRIRGIVATGQ